MDSPGTPAIATATPMGKAHSGSLMETVLVTTGQRAIEDVLQEDHLGQQEGDLAVEGHLTWVEHSVVASRRTSSSGSSSYPFLLAKSQGPIIRRGAQESLFGRTSV